MGSNPSQRAHRYLIIAAIVLATIVVYWQVWDFDFVAVDDELYVTGNPYVLMGLNPTSVRWALTGVGAGNWHPLTWISLMADGTLGKIVGWVFDTELDSGVYHLTNLALHIANALLLFLLLERLTGRRWRSIFVALMFAVHPLHVESVAWVSERKDVLSTLFWLLATLAYVRYTERGDRRSYGLVVLLMALGLAAKPMVVTLPFTLLLLDYWPLGRFVKGGRNTAKRLVMEKAPLFVLSAVFAVTTFIVQRMEQAVATTDIFGPWSRIANALVSYVSYVRLTFLPKGLAAFYPHVGASLSPFVVAMCAIGLVVATRAAIQIGRTRPYISVGWLWYMITLIPVIGLVQVGGQAMADRYMYVPLIGLLLIIAWGVPDLLGLDAKPGKVRRFAVVVFAALSIIAMMAVAYRQVGYWRDGITIWTRTANVTKNNARAYYNLGCALDITGELNKAIAAYETAVRIEPGKQEAQNNLGYALMRIGRMRDAKPHIIEAIRLDRTDDAAHNNLGLILMQEGKLDEAIRHFSEAARLDPTDESARENLDRARALKGE